MNLRTIIFVLFLAFLFPVSPIVAQTPGAGDQESANQVAVDDENGQAETASPKVETTKPIIILIIGIATVLGMIILGKVNAFISLITAAIVVSLLAVALMGAGSWAESISRVATSFGSTAGKIGIVIALAAVIGKCMLDSGAADRIVRAFLSILGEKRSPIALMGSGFVLAVPVFFDTVFYLLVPLARSLYRTTQKNYLKYILAISAGGAITHTLVPPTPGPLTMAATLKFDVGIMIMIGALVALPAAIAGLIFSGIADRLTPIPMRTVGNEPEPDPLEDAQLPSLFMSLLPVLLPVLLISTNTVTETITKNVISAELREQGLEQTEATTEGADQDTTKALSPNEFNQRVGELLHLPNELQGDSAKFWATAAGYTNVIGNANLALLLSTVIAMFMLMKQRGLTRTEMAGVVEVSLMSAGVIILITAGGGAFGEMLKTAKVGEAIQALFSVGGGGGMAMLVLGFSIASVLKIAQGSSTAAMIIGSGMLAGIADPDQLGFHPVYLATAIGAGSLVGSWMNDSGFWIFAKMGGLTEVEALKSWTPLLAVLGIVSFLTTLLLATVLPLV